MYTSAEVFEFLSCIVKEKNFEDFSYFYEKIF
jgi:hypothetical protein